ncbi:MAG: cupin domain-containing protein, partial [SAR324 cluster bacterium]|nr:cupin domain-containing protein [SAR324 cluster bacterium]
MTIKVEIPSTARLKGMGVTNWPIWTKEVSEFPWTYTETETCYFLEGEVIVESEGNDPVVIGKGDLVIFPAGLSCVWK